MAEADPKIVETAVLSLEPAFAVRLSSLLAVEPFISVEPTRYYLNGVYVEPCPKGGAICVATDGHKLGAQRDPEGIVNVPQIVTLPAVFKLPSKTAGKAPRSPWVVCMAAGGRGHLSLVGALMRADEDTAEAAIARVDECDLRYGRAVIDGTFPDWRRVVPAASEADITRSFNGDFLKSFGRYFTMTGSDQTAPHLVKTTDSNFVGVVMPMRMIDGPRPDWFALPA